MRHERYSVALMVALFAIGCGSGGGGGNPEGKGPSTNATCDPAKYPCGPYGYYPDDVVEDLQLVGRTDTNANGVIDSADTQRVIRLSDYYQNKNIKAIVVLVAAEWCNPCRVEQPGLVEMAKQYKIDGDHVAFIEAIAENNSGAPADITVLDRWAKQYGIPFDLAVDPTNSLGPYYDRAAIPMQMIVSTSTMKIEWKNNGLANDHLRGQIDAILRESSSPN